MKTMSGRERLMRVFRQQETDRIPIWLWGVDPMFPSGRPSWDPLYELVEKYELDIMRHWHPSREATARPAPQPDRWQSDKPDMWEYERVTKTPKGDLTQVHYQPKDGSPGYIKKHPIETVEDAEKWLSIPHRIVEPTVEVDSYFELRHKTGDRTILMVDIGEAMYSIQVLMGSEVFAVWMVLKADLLHEMISRYMRESRTWSSITLPMMWEITSAGLGLSFAYRL